MTIQERDSPVPVGCFVPLHGDVNRLAFVKQSSTVDDRHNSFPNCRPICIEPAQQLTHLLGKFFEFTYAAIDMELAQVMWFYPKGGNERESAVARDILCVVRIVVGCRFHSGWFSSGCRFHIGDLIDSLTGNGENRA